MFVYKTKYFGTFTTRVSKHMLDFPSTETTPQLSLRFMLYIVPKNYALYTSILEADKLKGNTIEKESDIYIVSHVQFSDANLRVIEDFIPTEFPEVLIYPTATYQKPVHCLASLSDALAKYGSIYVHYGDFCTDLYQYRNIGSTPDTLHMEDDVVLYKNYHMRNTLEMMHSKFSSDKLKIFQGYPIHTLSKVMVLPPEWTVVPQCDGKIACLYDTEIFIWLVTRDYTFACSDTTVKRLGTTLLNTNAFSANELDRIIYKFESMGFDNVNFTEQLVYAEDVQNTLFVFCGPITHAECGIYGDIIKKFL